MKKFTTALLLASFLAPLPAYATRTVTSPYVENKAVKLKWKNGYTHDDESESRDGAVQQQYAAEVGVFDRLSIEGELYAQNLGDDDNTDITAFAVKPKIQFTEKGKYWLDAGMRVAYEHSLTDDPDSVEVKLLLAKDLEKSRHIANIILDREVGEDSADDTSLGFSCGSRYKLNPAFEPGFEYYGNTGSLSDRDDFDDQDHSIGPVAYGKLGDHFKYEAGYLVGITENAADGRFKAILEYSFKF